MLQGEVGTHGSGDIGREYTLEERAGGAQGHLEVGVVQGHNAYIGHICNIHGGIGSLFGAGDEVHQVLLGIVRAVADGALQAVDKVLGGEGLAVRPLQAVLDGEGVGQAIFRLFNLFTQIILQDTVSVGAVEVGTHIAIDMGHVGGGNQCRIQGGKGGGNRHSHFLSRCFSGAVCPVISAAAAGQHADCHCEGQEQ